MVDGTRSGERARAQTVRRPAVATIALPDGMRSERVDAWEDVIACRRRQKAYRHGGKVAAVDLHAQIRVSPREDLIAGAGHIVRAGALERRERPRRLREEAAVNPAQFVPVTPRECPTSVRFRIALRAEIFSHGAAKI